MYNTIYELITQFLYGSAPLADSYEHLIAVGLSGVLSVAMVLLPFIVVAWLFRGWVR